MKKAIEMAIKGNKDIDFNSEEFKGIKRQIDANIKKALGDKYDDFTYQCNCLKSFDEETGELTILVKVYIISKELQDTEQEINFLLNEDDEYLKTSKVSSKKTKTDKTVKEFEINIQTLKDKIISIQEKIDDELSMELTDERIAKLNKLSTMLKTTQNELETQEKKLIYYKAEFLI